MEAEHNNKKRESPKNSEIIKKDEMVKKDSPKLVP